MSEINSKTYFREGRKIEEISQHLTTIDADYSITFLSSDNEIINYFDHGKKHVNYPVEEINSNEIDENEFIYVKEKNLTNINCNSYYLITERDLGESPIMVIDHLLNDMDLAQLEEVENLIQLKKQQFVEDISEEEEEETMTEPIEEEENEEEEIITEPESIQKEEEIMTEPIEEEEKEIINEPESKNEPAEIDPPINKVVHPFTLYSYDEMEELGFDQYDRVREDLNDYIKKSLDVITLENVSKLKKHLEMKNKKFQCNRDEDCKNFACLFVHTDQQCNQYMNRLNAILSLKIKASTGFKNLAPCLARIGMCEYVLRLWFTICTTNDKEILSLYGITDRSFKAHLTAFLSVMNYGCEDAKCEKNHPFESHINPYSKCNIKGCMRRHF